MRYHLKSVRMAIFMTSIGESVQKREPSFNTGGIVNQNTTWKTEYNVEVLPKKN